MLYVHNVISFQRLDNYWGNPETGHSEPQQYIPAIFCLTDIDICTVTELYQSVWGTIGIKILCVHRFCKFGLDMWPSSFSAHEQRNWKEDKGQRGLYVTQEEKMETLNFSYYACFIGIFQHFPLLLLMLFVILPSKRNFIGVKWCQHFPLLICCGF